MNKMHEVAHLREHLSIIQKNKELSKSFEIIYYDMAMNRKLINILYILLFSLIIFMFIKF